MKKHVLSAAIAVASLAGLSQSAFAAGLQPSNPPQLELFMSGASAQNVSIQALFQNLCGADLSIFRGSNGTGADHTAYYCTLTPAEVPGLSGPLRVLLHKRSAGGSAQGVNPLIDGTPIAAMNIRAGNCTSVNPAANPELWNCTSTANVTPIPAFDPAVPNLTSNLFNALSDAGVSDVEPKLFVGVNKPNNADAVNPAEADAVLNVFSGGALIFGVPVSDNLYAALQIAQGLRSPGVCDSVATEYTDACMPSLTKQQVATLISGQVRNWSEFRADFDNNPATPATTLVQAVAGQTYTDVDDTDNNPATPPVLTVRNVTPTDTKVHYCKRIDGSGTGAQQYAKFLNTPCSTAGLNPDWAGSLLAGPVKHELSGSGDMERCLEDFADGEQNGRQFTAFVNGADTFTNVVNNNTTLSTTPNPANARTAWAIGQQSLENNVTHARHYRFIKIDGVAPTLQNVFTGKYFDWVEPTYQVRKAVTGNAQLVLEKIANDAASPAIIATDLNPRFIHAFGPSGYLASSRNAFTDVFNPASPVVPYSHSVSGGLSNCQVPVMPAPTATNPSKPFRGM